MLKSVYPPKTTFCRMYKNMGFFKAKHYIFLWWWWALVVFQSIEWLSFVKMLFCSWLSFSKMQFCGYPSFKWDLVGCFSLNTKKNEKKNYSNFLEGVSPEKKEKSNVGSGVD